MKTKNLSLLMFSVFAVVLFAGVASAVTFADWPLTSDGVGTNVDVAVTAGAFTSSGVTENGFDASGINTENWSTATSADSTKYLEVTVSPKSSDAALIITGVSFDYLSSVATSSSFDLNYSNESGFASPKSLTSKTDVSSTSKSSSNTGLEIVATSGETITFRWFGYNFAATTNEFQIKDFKIEGDVVPLEAAVCTNTGNSGDLNVKKIDLKNDGLSHRTFGEDDQWFPLEDIEVEIEIENDGNEDIEDIEVEWGLWDTEAREWVIEPDEEKDFNLRDGKEEVLTVTFKLDDDLDVDLEDLSDGEKYRFYAFATGTVDDATSDETCASDFEAVEMVIENDFVVLDDIQFPQTVQCGDTVQVTADVWNVGDDDQDDVSVEVTSVGGDLGLRETVTIGDIDGFDKERMIFEFDVPRNTPEGTYSIEFSVVDEDRDVYENDFDDDESQFTIGLRVDQCSASGTGTGTDTGATVTASLESEARAGEQVVVRSTLTNNEDELKTFTVNAAGFTGWASAVNVDQTSVVLGEGQSREVRFTFDALDDASGTQTFFIEAVSGNEVIRQPVSVTIEPKSGGLGGVGLPFLIGIINVILVIVIIIVAVRVARR